MDMLRRILDTFASIPGVYATVISARDGLIIDGVANRSVDLEALAALAATSVGTMEAIGRDYGQGDLDIIISEYSGGMMVMGAIGPEYILAVASTPESPVGKIRHEIKRYRELIRDLL